MIKVPRFLAGRAPLLRVSLSCKSFHSCRARALCQWVGHTTRCRCGVGQRGCHRLCGWGGRGECRNKPVWRFQEGSRRPCSLPRQRLSIIISPTSRTAPGAHFAWQPGGKITLMWPTLVRSALRPCLWRTIVLSAAARIQRTFHCWSGELCQVRRLWQSRATKKATTNMQSIVSRHFSSPKVSLT